jgi:hypothetical protein
MAGITIAMACSHILSANQLKVGSNQEHSQNKEKK